jgi:uroporphyrinogen decarboxylase
MNKPRNDTLLRALRREPTAYTPIWLMRQAGRYLPEYNATRARAGSFMHLCRDPDLATEVTLQPLARFPLDAAILFSDILTVPDAMGLGLSFSEGEGPRFERPLVDEAAITKLGAPDFARLQYVFDAVAAIKGALNDSVPLIGFAGSPFTLACYMIDGRSSTEFVRTRQLLYTRPDLLHRVLEINAAATATYLVEQARNGADAVMIFDTWGGLLTARTYVDFSLAYIQRVITEVRQRYEHSVPIIVFTKGGGQWLERTAGCGCDAIGLDWSTDLGEARSRVGQRVALQGNLDPQVLLASPGIVEREAQAVLRSAGPDPGHVFNLGHGILPSTPPENVAALVACVREHSGVLHRGASARAK